MYFYIQGDSREKAMGGLRNENGAHPINIYTQHMPPIDTITLVHKSATEAQENRDLEKSSRQRAAREDLLNRNVRFLRSDVIN